MENSSSQRKFDGMTVRRIPATTITAIFTALIAALIARTLLQAKLVAIGYDTAFARDLAYLVVPVIFALFFFPLWRSERKFLAAQFRLSRITWQLAAQAIAIGCLLRAAWWSQLIASVSLGFVRSSDAEAIVGPVFSFQCPAPIVLALGFFVMAGLVPLFEEIVHRAYTVGALRHRGFVVAILGSALVFAIFHRSASIPFAFLAGIVFGIQYWLTRSLWVSLLSHATVNGLVQIDWRCLSGHWNPAAADLPLWAPGITASSVLLACVILIGWLLSRMATGARPALR